MTKPKTKKKPEVRVSVILDKSGSMSAFRDSSISGYNQYIQSLKMDKDINYLVSLTMFDTEYKIIYVDMPLENVPPLTKETYRPDGMTALFDSIGKTIDSLKKSEKPKQKTILAVLTDGQENSSLEYKTVEMLNPILTEAQKKWTVIYLAATQEAWGQGDLLGIAQNIAYDQGDEKATFSTLARGVSYMAHSDVTRSDTFWQDAKKTK